MKSRFLLTLACLFPVLSGKAGTVSGLIVNGAGQPLPGVSVHVDQFLFGGENGPWDGVSGADGRYSISDPALFGNVRITPSLAGFAPTPGFVDVFFDIVTTANFRMDRPGFRVLVRTTGGSPLSGATVVAERTAGGGALTLSGTTGSDGICLLNSDPPASGTFMLRPQMAGKLFPAVTSTLPPGATTHTSLTIDQVSLFTEISSLPTTAPNETISWADYDGDGRMDMLALGNHLTFTPTARLFRQEGSLTFEQTFSPQPVTNGEARWRDFDNDGDLDVAIVGQSSLRIYAQNAGTFALVREMAGMIRPHLTAGDIDNDGRDDLILTGDSPANSNPALTILLNRGGMNFEPAPDLFPSEPVVRPANGTAGLVDFNRDGALDVSTSGFGSGGDFGLVNFFHTQFLQRSERLLFGRTSVVPPTGVPVSVLTAWVDANGDGLPDCALGATGSTLVTFVLPPAADGQARFRHSTPQSRANRPGGLAWADLNADGFPELTDAGDLRLWHVRDDDLVPIAVTALPSAHHACVAAADVNGDHRMDLSLSGSSAVNETPNKLLESRSSPINGRPTAPTGLGVQQFGSYVRCFWEPASDDTTPTVSLTYNLRMGTTSGGVDLVSPEADPLTGRRWICEPGAATAPAWVLRRLPRGVTIHWAVQAIDSSFEGGPWSAEQTFVMPTIDDFTRSGDGSVRLKLTSGFPPLIETSTDLQSWNGISNQSTQEKAPGQYEVTDGDAANLQRRFYRVGLQ